MSVKIILTGDKEIDAALKALPLALSHKTLGSVYFAASKIVVAKEKLLAPEGPTGNLVDSIGATRTTLKKANALGEVTVGPRRRRPYKGFAGHLVEFGTKPRETKKGARRGVMPKEPFAEPTWQATKGPLEGFIAKNTGDIMIKTMKRYIK